MTMSTREELKLKEWILTLMIECNTNDYYRDKANLIDKRTQTRDQMFKEGGVKIE